MKKLKIYLFAAAAAAFTMNTSVAEADTATANSSATVVAAINLTAVSPLAFGKFVADGSSAGSVVIAPNGTRTGNVVTVVPSSTKSAASFTVSGENGLTYAVTLPSSTTLSDGGTNSMTVNTFTSSLATGTVGTDNSFTVGATLNVDAAQAAGAYTGTFDVSVDYN